MLPIVLDYRVTSKCNMKCPFCFGTKVPEIETIEKQYAFLQRIRNLGVNNIVLTGGEPTLVPGFVDLVKKLREMDFNLVLSTNGLFWDNSKLRSFVLENMSCISLPIESTLPEVHNELRQGVANHFQLICKVFEDLGHGDYPVKIKISTVVTKKNIYSIDGILAMLPFTPDVWKLYQLSRCASNMEFYLEQRVSNEDFQKSIDRLKTRYRDVDTRIVSALEEDRHGKYLFLEPDGSLMTINNDKEEMFAYISEPDEVILEKINQMVDDVRTNENFIYSFT